MSTKSRLDKYLADCGAGTRSQLRHVIRSSRVGVDGEVQKDPGYPVGPDQSVTLDGMPLKRPGRLILMMNKPAGYVTATEDAWERTVMELLPETYRASDLKPVGRLDKETEGLLLFTNDGALLHRLISPKRAVPKVYLARHEGKAGEEDRIAFEAGLELEDGTKCRPALLEILAQGESLVMVTEGKYHQVRRMMASRGLPVQYLRRIREGSLSLGELPLGQCRLLSEDEIGLLEKY